MLESGWNDLQNEENDLLSVRVRRMISKMRRRISRRQDIHKEQWEEYVKERWKERERELGLISRASR